MPRLLEISVALAWLLASPSLVYAHGGMGAEEVKPMAASAAVAFVSYWLVILWPSRQRNLDAPLGGRRVVKTRFDADGSGYVPGKTSQSRQVPELKIIRRAYGRDSAANE